MRPAPFVFVAALTAFAAPISSVAFGATPSPDFVRDVRPILEKHCYECHGPTKQKSGLRLDVKHAAFHSGDGSAPNILPGRAADSPLIQFIAAANVDDRMPPEGDGLTAAEIATLTAWVDAGAVWPEGVDTAQLEDKRDHWSFKPLTSPEPPTTRDSAWPRHPIDRFVLAKLEQESLRPSPEAPRDAWLRRVSFDLIGLPPSPAQVAAFAADRRPDAYERVVEELLASPRYGERWAQHWLDVVRYADTHGFEVNTERPNAWPYRDYVIRAFNRDTPYDRFVKEQLVGDALGEDTATGFLVTASVLLPGQIGKDEPSKRLARQDALDEIVTNIGQTFLGLSVSCARCHDHKFDPISAKDYYAMQAFVAGVEYGERPLRTPDAEAARREIAALRTRLAAADQELAHFSPLAGAGVVRPMVNARENVDRFAPVKARRLRFTIRATNSLEPCLDELEIFGPASGNLALAGNGATVTSSGDTIVADRHDLKHLNDGQYGNTRSWVSNESGRGWVVVEFPAEQIVERVVWGRDRLARLTDRVPTDYVIEVAGDNGEWRSVADASDRLPFDPADKKSDAFRRAGLTPAETDAIDKLVTERRNIERRLAAETDRQRVFVGKFRTPDVIRHLSRGDPEQPPAVLSALGNITLTPATPEQQRRQALADWVATPENPLTARVMANRIWQWHFGTGLVETASDFGRMGTKPSHPELLDWLAGEFIRSGWSMKHLHRLIVLSATYRQSAAIADRGLRSVDSATPSTHASAASPSFPNPQSAIRNPQLIDADVRLLWRFPSRRLEAEAIRDTMLAVSGRLNLTMYGRGFDLFDKRGGLAGFKPVESFKGEGLRRMVYAHKVRREREAVFGAFDCPDAGQSTARRRESTTPIQALNLFNSRFTLEQAEAFAADVAREAGPGADASRQVQLAYTRTLGRAPTPAEQADALAVVRTHGLGPLARALFNSNEFLFLP